MRDQPNAPKVTVSEGEVDAVNYLNVLLMLAALAVAAYIPFEAFFLAYVFLGPLHYLTEISWLHDRRYFSVSSRGVFLVLLPATALVAGLYIYKLPYSFHLSVILMGLMVVFAAGLIRTVSGTTRVCAALLGVLTGIMALFFEPLAILLIVFVPTLIHVYAFTGLFIFYGALKGRSVSGFVSTLVYLACPVACLYLLKTPEAYTTRESFVDLVTPFEDVIHYTMTILGLSESPEGLLACMRLMAFAYTYHYLNWFSKTRIINWHDTSRARLSWICVLYIGAIATYLIDFKLGFAVLFFLSMLHVVLEFPLDYRTAVGIFSSVSKRIYIKE
jgi:hypothetical protein